MTATILASPSEVDANLTSGIGLDCVRPRLHKETRR